MSATSEKCNKADCGSAKCLSAHDFYFLDKVLQMLRPLSIDSSQSPPTIPQKRILGTIMKTSLMGGVFLLAMGSAMAEPDDVRVQAAVTDAPVMVMPVSIQDDEPHTQPKLRDVLRQPYDDIQALNNQPYRLSVEERHRMREQLRSQLANKNKP
jgi:hypothetical protein